MTDFQCYRAHQSGAASSHARPAPFKTLTPDPDHSEEATALRNLLTSDALYPYPETTFAFKKARSLHTGLRKGGAPEFSHQVAMATFFLNQIKLLQSSAPLTNASLSRMLSLIFLHDTYEDGLASKEDLIAHLGTVRTHDVVSISKVFYNGNGKIKLKWPSYRTMMLYGVPCEPHDLSPNHPVNYFVVLAKGIDRLHNLSCCYALLMSAAIMRCEPEYWTRDRVRRYMRETQECHIPLLKEVLAHETPDVHGLKPYIENTLKELSDLVERVQAYVR